MNRNDVWNLFKLTGKIEYFLKYKDMIDTFKVLEEERQDIFTKEPINLSEYRTEEVTNDGGLSLDDLQKEAK